MIEKSNSTSLALATIAILGQPPRLHARIGNIRQDGLHQLTTDLTHRLHTIGIEDLNVRGMVKNRHLSRVVSDMGFFEFRRQLDDQAAQRGGMIIVADRWYPSSKMCSDCGHKLETLPLAVSSTMSACGEEGSGLGRKLKTKPASVKQEFSSKATYG